MTSSDAILANLTPALVAEANMLRERFARRYNRTLFGMYPRNRRGESSRRGEVLDRASGILARRSMGNKPVEAEGSPLVDTEDLKAMIRLLRIVQVFNWKSWFSLLRSFTNCCLSDLIVFQPLYKGQLQRLLLNLSAHAETRSALVKILVDLLMLDIKKPTSCFDAAEPLYRLYACQSHVTYSRPQYVDGKTTFPCTFCDQS